MVTKPANSHLKLPMALGCLLFSTLACISAPLPLWAQAAPSCRSIVTSSMAAERMREDINKWKKLESTIKRQSDEEAFKTLSQDSTRRIFFRLQGLSRMHETHDEKFFSETREKFKSAEDMLGQANLTMTLLNKAIELKHPQLIKYFTEELEKTKTKTLKYFRSGLDFDEVLNYSKWLTGKEEKEDLIEIITDGLDNLQKQIDKQKFDQADIEEGLHELRRKLRWIIIEITGLSGYVDYSKAQPSSADVLKLLKKIKARDPKIYESPYLQIGAVKINRPIKIPFHHMAIISHLISVIGEKKDQAETYLYFSKALGKMGLSSAEKKKILAQLHVEPVDHEKLSVEYQNWISDADLLSDMAQQIEDLNE